MSFNSNFCSVILLDSLVTEALSSSVGDRPASKSRFLRAAVTVPSVEVDASVVVLEPVRDVEVVDVGERMPAAFREEGLQNNLLRPAEVRFTFKSWVKK